MKEGEMNREGEIIGKEISLEREKPLVK